MSREEIRVILGEPSADHGRLLKELLEPTKYRVVGEAACGDELVEMVEEKRPEIVILCLATPGHQDRVGDGGYNIIPRLLDVNRKLRIVVTHSVDTQYLVMAALKAGAAARIRKPFKRDAVLEGLMKGEEGARGAAAAARTGARLQRPLAVLYKKAEDGFFQKFRSAIADDLSVTGIGMKGPERLQAKSLIKVKIELPGKKKVVIRCQAQVMRCKKIAGIGLYEVGLAFTNLPPAAHEAINTYILESARK